MTSSPWQPLADAKRQSILDAIPSKWRIQDPIPPATELRDVTGSYIEQFLTSREIEITNLDAYGIAEKTTTGKWAAVEVTEAFCHRAALAHQLVNCLHEIFFDAAIEDAKRLDAYFAEHKKPLGPLHGLPISLKDQFHVKGVETTMGYVGWIDTFQGLKGDPRYRMFESELVGELRALGAVLYCKTSVPATLMCGETINNIITYTTNPKNRLLSCGGSSGGEGALIALKGSPAGFGTDIGGSVRIPAVFNGLFGIRPSSGRIPYEGAANSMNGQNTILSVIGPLAATVRSLQFLFKAVLGQQPWLHDPLVLELPWRSEIEQETRTLVEQSAKDPSRLAFAIMKHDGVAIPHPPIARALGIVEQTLKRLGHKVIEWTPPSHSTACELASATYNLDGGADVQHHFGLSGEEPAAQVIVPKGLPQKTAVEIAKLNVAKREYQKLYMDYWNSTSEVTGTGRPVDGVICAAAPHAAVVPNQYPHVGYTSFINLLDYTSVVIPVTHADKGVDVAEPREFLNELDEKLFKNYDAEVYDGAPAGVQLFGRRLQEEKMLVLAEYSPEDSGPGEESQTHANASKSQTQKDRKCQYCNQAFTSSSLGRHLDQFLFKKKPDGIHDVEEIRRIRSGITRRQARTSTGKRDTPERGMMKGSLDSQQAGDAGGKGPIRMMFNTPTWHATGVINDIPNPSQSHEPASRIATSQSRLGTLAAPDLGARTSHAGSPDTVRALELALREVLDNIKAATSRTRPRISPFEFDIQVQTFPSLCLQLLPSPPTLFAANPFPSSSSFPLDPPGHDHHSVLRQAIRVKIEQWQSDQLSAEATNNSLPGRSSLGMDSGAIQRNAQQHEELSLRHLELAFKHWVSLPYESRKDAWQLEIMRAFAREAEKRKSLDDQLARVQQEANQLRSQVEKLGSCQWPREFALFPPETLPLPRDVARELDSKESQISPGSARWDYENVVAKWKRVIMHDRTMGRVGIPASPLPDEPASANSADTKPRAMPPPSSALSPSGGPSPGQHPTSPYMSHESPNAGPHPKRQCLMNGRHAPGEQRSTAASATQGGPLWNPNPNPQSSTHPNPSSTSPSSTG
ncbi:amidase signature domain-containing protein [Aspergillus aurantiobrunneus]